MSVMNDFELHKLCPLYNGLKGFELSDREILDSGKFYKLDELLDEIKLAVNCLIYIFLSFIFLTKLMGFS